jgi:serine/threonine-protein kinase
MALPAQDQMARCFEEASRLQGAERASYLEQLGGLGPAQEAELHQLLAAADEIAEGHGLIKELPGSTAPMPTQLTVSKVLPAAPARDETAILLRRRLLYATGAGLALSGAFLVKNLSDGHYTTGPGWLFAAHLATFLICLFLTLGLWARRRLGERSLRLLELMTLLGALLFFGPHQLYQLQVCQPHFGRATEVDEDVVDLTGEAIAFRWFMLIVAYGIFIPNSQRRFWSTILVLATVPLVLTAWVGFASGVVEPVVNMLVEMAIWLALAVVIAAAGTIIIRRLRWEAGQVGAYLIDNTHPLGTGGMGLVYHATHRQMLQPCAVKFILPERTGDASSREGFLREARTMAQISHPHVVQVYNCGEHEGLLFLVMEYLSGMTLLQFVDGMGALPPGRAVYFLLQACSALAYLHRKGFVHNDVKPSNLFVCEYGGMPDFVKVLDFGISGRPAGDRGDLPALGGMGTPGYAAPERLTNASAPLDPRSDLFSLGATAYFLLTGQPPFQRGTVLATVSAVLREEPPSLAELLPDAADLAAAVSRCLARDPAARFQDVLELETALRHCRCTADWDVEKARQWWDERVLPEALPPVAFHARAG